MGIKIETQSECPNFLKEVVTIPVKGAALIIGAVVIGAVAPVVLLSVTEGLFSLLAKLHEKIFGSADIGSLSNRTNLISGNDSLGSFTEERKAMLRCAFVCLAVFGAIQGGLFQK